MAKAKINPEFTYKTRDGKEVTNLRLNDFNIYPIMAEVEGYSRTYTDRGYYYTGGFLSEYDLIKQPAKKPKPVKEVQKEVIKNASILEVNQQDIPPTQHVHHDMIVAWAKNPKLKFQWKDKRNGQWHTELYPKFMEEFECRFKPEEPKFLTIIGADGKARSYPEPCKVKPSLETTYYFPIFSPPQKGLTDWYVWVGDELDNTVFNKSFLHLTKEAAELHAKAMFSID